MSAVQERVSIGANGLNTHFIPRYSHEKEIEPEERNDYFLAHINRGVELLVNRVRGLENLAQLIKAN